MTDTELTELLQSAARATGQDVRPDAGALILRARRSRRRQRIVGLCGVVVVALLAATAVPALLDRGDGGVEVAAGDEKDGFAPGWTRLPDPPLSPRTGATAAWTGREVVVVGGHVERCRPPASQGCQEPVPLSDGASYDIGRRTWRTIAPPPIPFTNRLPAAQMNGDLLLLVPCSSPACPEKAAMLRYRAGADAWDVLPAPPGPPASQRLTSAGGDLFAAGVGDPDGTSVWRFDMASATWAGMPARPSSLTNGVLFADGEDLLAFGTDVQRGRVPVRAVIAGARLDSKTGAWTDLPTATGDQVLPQVLDGLVILTPAGSLSAVDSGGILDLGSSRWRGLPAPPPLPRTGLLGEERVGEAMVGAIGQTTSVYRGGAGWALDTTTSSWVQIPPIDDRYSDISITSFGRRLFSFGGTRAPGGGSGQLLNDAWVWTPPPDAPTGATTDPTAGLAAPTTTSPAPPPPTEATAPTAPTGSDPPGAPRFVSATGDAAAGRVTLRFDRPVTGDPVDKSPGAKTFSPVKTHPMSLIVFGPDRACTSPQGNGQDYVSGLGTDTVTFEATSLAPGTTYVGIGQGLVKSVADGTFNAAVVRKDLPSAGMFTGMSCIPVATSGSVPTTVPYTEPAGGPELLSATATSGGGAAVAPGMGAGRITLKFDKPVVPGDGPNFDGSSPNLQPAAGDDYMRAMQLVVHMGDSSCSSPNGNAHAYLSGVGTDTLTVDASSLVVGTTFISINPGFAKGAADGKAMRWVRCLALAVT